MGSIPTNRLLQCEDRKRMSRAHPLSSKPDAILQIHVFMLILGSFSGFPDNNSPLRMLPEYPCTGVCTGVRTVIFGATSIQRRTPAAEFAWNQAEQLPMGPCGGRPIVVEPK